MCLLFLCVKINGNNFDGIGQYNIWYSLVAWYSITFCVLWSSSFTWFILKCSEFRPDYNVQNNEITDSNQSIYLRKYAHNITTDKTDQKLFALFSIIGNLTILCAAYFYVQCKTSIFEEQKTITINIMSTAEIGFWLLDFWIEFINHSFIESTFKRQKRRCHDHDR